MAGQINSTTRESTHFGESGEHLKKSDPNLSSVINRLTFFLDMPSSVASHYLVIPGGALLIRASISIFLARDRSFVSGGHLPRLTVRLLSSGSVNKSQHYTYLNKKTTHVLRVSL